VSNKTKTTKGIDIVMAIDRLEVCRPKTKTEQKWKPWCSWPVDFVEERPNDRIGLVVYALKRTQNAGVTSDKAVIWMLSTAI
jgi:Ca-activated chloride channel family protein